MARAFSAASNEKYSEARVVASMICKGKVFNFTEIREAVGSNMKMGDLHPLKPTCYVKEWAFFSEEDAKAVAKKMLELSSDGIQKLFGK